MGVISFTLPPSISITMRHHSQTNEHKFFYFIKWSNQSKEHTNCLLHKIELSIKPVKKFFYYIKLIFQSNQSKIFFYFIKWSKQSDPATQNSIKRITCRTYMEKISEPIFLLTYRTVDSSFSFLASSTADNIIIHKASWKVACVTQDITDSYSNHATLTSQQ